MRILLHTFLDFICVFVTLHPYYGWTVLKVLLNASHPTKPLPNGFKIKFTTLILYEDLATIFTK